jgi:multicomponent Na+:H+ antiporter subunit D
MESSVPIAVISVPLFAALVLPLVRRLSPRIVHPLAVVAGAGALVAAIYQIVLVVRLGQPLVSWLGGWEPPWGIEFRVDHLGAIMALLVTSLSFLVLVFAREGLEERLERRSHFYYSLYLLFTVGLIGFVQTGDLFNLYVFLEVIALTGYALIAVGEPQSPFAAFRYVILGTLAASFYLVGLAYLYGITGSLNFVDVAARLGTHGAERSVLVALAFLLVGFGIKAALFPLHAWLPDAYTYSPSVTAAFMAAVGTKIGAYGVFRVMFTIYEIGSNRHPVTEIMGWMAAIAIIVGSILAIAQTDLKRMLAYSSVSQIGYVLLGFSLVNPAGITGGVLHIVNHAFMKASLFMVAGAVMARLGHRDIRRFAGLGREMPVAMAAFTVAALSMVGLPPLAGFFSKWYLVVGAVDAGKWPFVVVILVSSLLNAVYFFRVLERVYLAPVAATEPADAPARTFAPLPLTMSAPLGVTAIAILLLGLGSWPLVEHVVRHIVPAGL